MPKISVVIPNYNHGPFLKQRIDSVLNQTLGDFELIILDDCSSDNSREIIKKYAANDKRIHFYFNETNSGSTFKQWKKGIELAKGEYIWIAESDDWCESSFLEVVMEKFFVFPNVGLVYCQSWKIDEHDQILGSWKEWTDVVDKAHWNEDFMNKGKQELQNYFCLRNTIPNASAVVFDKSLSDSLPSQVFEMRLCGDKMVWTSMLLKTDIYFIAKPLNYFRAHINSVRSSVNSVQNLYENFIWVNYLLDNVQLKKKEYKQIKLWLLRWWIKSVDRSNLKQYFLPILQYGFKMDFIFGGTLTFKFFIKMSKTLLQKVNFF